MIWNHPWTKINNIINQWNQKMWVKMTCKYVQSKHIKENQSQKW
jgi:hypothetical protein